MKIFVYADSRGACLNKRFGVKKYKTYVEMLKDEYDVESYVRNWSTLVGFLDMYKNKVNDYEAVIVHAGIVDHAPRRTRVCRERVYKGDKRIFDEIFGEEEISNHLKNTIEVCKGECISNMYSIDMANAFLLPRLKTIPNLIWITSNRYIREWKFNRSAFKQHVPENINIIIDYARLFEKHLNIVDLTELSDDEIKKYSFDNIHFNLAGHEFLYDKIVKKIGDVTWTQ